MIKVLVVDDHPIFRSGAITAIDSKPDMEVVGEAEDASEALELLNSQIPDVVLTDIRLKGEVNGVEFARRVRTERPDTGIVVLTNYSNEPYVRAMMEANVEGYLLKDTPPHEVIEAIRMVVDGRRVYSTKVSEFLVKGYLGNNDQRMQEHITERETSVLQLIVEGASNKEIADQLHISVTTVQYHLTNIYSKLGVRSRAEAIVQAAREGLVVIE